MELMLGSDYASQNCSIARALEAVGERWTLLIVRELLRKPRRFVDLERSLAISKNVLTSRLEKLVQWGIAEKVPYQESRDWNTYQLTDKGLDLFPVIAALMTWGDSYEAPDGAPAVFEHTTCGHPTGHKVVCEFCNEVVDARSIRTVAGPGYRGRDHASRSHR